MGLELLFKFLARHQGDFSKLRLSRHPLLPRFTRVDDKVSLKPLSVSLSHLFVKHFSIVNSFLTLLHIHEEKIDVELFPVKLSVGQVFWFGGRVQHGALLLGPSHIVMLVQVEGSLVLEATNCNVEAIQTLVVFHRNVSTFGDKKFEHDYIAAEGSPHQRGAAAGLCAQVDFSTILKQHQNQ